MRYRIHGADAESKSPMELVVDAASIAEAEAEANARGIIVSRIETAAAPAAAPSPTPQRPADDGPFGDSVEDERANTPETTVWRGRPSQWSNVAHFALAAVAAAIIMTVGFLILGALEATTGGFTVVFAALLIAGVYAAWRWLMVHRIAYELTSERMIRRTGILRVDTEEIELYRIKDIGGTHSLAQRIVGVGTIIVESSDKTCPRLVMPSIARYADVQRQIRTGVETVRRLRKVREVDMGYDFDHSHD